MLNRVKITLVQAERSEHRLRAGGEHWVTELGPDAHPGGEGVQNRKPSVGGVWIFS